MATKICILTFGTRGDVQPYLALGLGLQAAGYEVTIATEKPTYKLGDAMKINIHGCLLYTSPSPRDS